MAVAERSASVIIEKEEFSILSSPEATSKLVKAEVDHLLGHVDLSALSNDLGRVGKLVRLAYFAAKGCGYGKNMVEMKMNIYDLGTDVTDLCSLSAHTVSSFRSASRDVMQELHAAYEYLLEGFEEEAIDCFDTISATAAEMAGEAKALQDEFNDKQKQVRETIQTLERIEDDRKGKQKETEERRIKLQAKEEAYKAQIDQLRMLEEEARRKKDMYEQKSDEEMKNIQEPGFWKVIGRILTGTKDSVRERVREWRNESVKQYEAEKEQRSLKNKMLEDEMSALAEIKTCDILEGDINTAIKSLEAVSSALMQLTAVMKNAVNFWKLLERQCKKIADANFKRVVEKAIARHPEEKRLEYWHSRGFKISAVRYCAKWVALHSVCTEYAEGIKTTQEKLTGYITQNPSKEEAQRALPAMIAELRKEAEEVQKANRKLDLVANSKIKELQEAATEVE